MRKNMPVALVLAVQFFIALVGPDFSAAGSLANESKAGKKFDRVMIIILENQDGSSVLKDPYMLALSRRGAYFSNFHGVSHPSYPNYLAMTAGSTFGMADNKQKELNVTSVADLLEAKGLGWAMYAEGYPGSFTNCFTGAISGAYARKHTPFLSYTPIMSGSRCMSHVADGLKMTFPFPEYVFYVPDMNNDGHDTGVEYLSNWLKRFLEPILARPDMDRTLVAVTFDECAGTADEPVYTLLLGKMVKADSTDKKFYNHYSLLRTIEDNFQLGTLGREDLIASPITSIWK